MTRPDIDAMTETPERQEAGRSLTIQWPEPKFVPMGDSGSQINPARVQQLADAIRQELVIGEWFMLAQNLLGEYEAAALAQMESNDG